MQCCRHDTSARGCPSAHTHRAASRGNGARDRAHDHRSLQSTSPKAVAPSAPPNHHPSPSPPHPRPPFTEGVPLAAILAAAALAAAVVAYHWRHALGSHRPPPRAPLVPGALPLLGNTLQVLPNLHRIHDWILDQQRRVGGNFTTFCFTLPFMRTFVAITHPAVLEHVLKTNMPNYVKGVPFRDNFGPLLGRGIFVSDGEEWRWQRKLATRIFSVKR
jgi:hypothetical protein